MDIYIDEKNLESFIGQKEDPLYYDVLKLLKRQLDIKFNFSKDTFKGNKILNSFATLLVSGLGDTSITFNHNFPTRPLKSNAANVFNPDQLSAIYWIDDEDYLKLKNIGAVVIGGLGEEIEVMNQLFLFQNDYLFERELTIGSEKFSKWEDIEKFSTPITDIIIIDPYIFKKNDPIKYNELLDINFIKWIGIIANKSNVKLNIVIVYNSDHLEFEFEDTGNGEDKVNGIKTRIKTRIEDVCGKNPKITFIRTYKEHDRTIITNYIRIKGNSFCYWNEKGIKINKGKDITIKSLAKLESYDNAFSAIKDIQEIIDKNPEHILGDKKSGYLNF